MFSIAIGDFVVTVDPHKLPELYVEYCKRALVADEFNMSDPQGRECFLAVGRGVDWPFLVIAQRYDPSGGLWPGLMLIPETQILFVAAASRLLCYALEPPGRLWEDQSNGGFWNWQRHGNIVLMAAELELAAWTIQGHKLWTTFVEPPWGYSVRDGMIDLDVMGTFSAFPIETGPGR